MDARVLTTDLLVVGAGPTGLMAGLVAHRRGLSALVVDGKSGPTRESRAIVIQARSMEILDQLGLVAPVLEAAQLAGRIRIREGGPALGADFASAQTGDTPFPGARIFEQSRTEHLLADALAAEGAPVSYGHALATFTADASAEEGVEAQLEGPDGLVTVRARWLLGADGASSPVRHLLGLPFAGVTDEATFCVADLHGIEGLEPGALTARFGRRRFAILFPLGPGGHGRLIWLHGGAAPDQEEALAGAREDLGIRYRRVDWFSAYRVHHRVAARFRQGPVFLAGDAAHVHSPVGGQGMNTGLQDAHHLANLLADVAGGLVGPAQLDRYEAERRPVALTLVRIVDRAFGVIARPGPASALVRRRARDVLGVLLPRVLASPVGRRLGGWLGQYRIHYHPLPGGASVPRWARDRAVGRRLPPTDENREALREMRWQLHSYGAAVPAARPRVPEAVTGPRAFPADPQGRLRSDLMYLVRPDGFVAAAWPLHAGAAAGEDVAEALAACGLTR
jgi:2-polyprenyl-6-methoxyphenol hydroxylase-like FAD-dependent oxidoreductase